MRRSRVRRAIPATLEIRGGPGPTATHFLLGPGHELKEVERHRESARETVHAVEKEVQVSAQFDA